MTPLLTAEQRYLQATRKAQLIRSRSLRQMLQGLCDFAVGGNDRAALIEEIDRAYRAGYADGIAWAESMLGPQARTIDGGGKL